MVIFFSARDFKRFLTFFVQFLAFLLIFANFELFLHFFLVLILQAESCASAIL